MGFPISRLQYKTAPKSGAEIDDFYSEFVQSLSEEMSSSEKLLYFCESQMNFIREYWGKELFRTLYTNAFTPNHNYFLDKNRPLYKIIYKFASEGQKAREFKQDLSPDDITMLITRCMRGTLFDWCIHDDDFDLVMETKKIIHTLLEGLKE